MRPKLSVIIPCRNERTNLRACVEAVREVADEIIIADSGSTDGTREIARSLDGCRLIEATWSDYATFKNWAIPQAGHPWVLIVDADERMTPALREEIETVLADTPAEIDGYWIGFRSFFLGHELRFASYNTPALRLFRRDRCRYSNRRVHEEISVDRKRTRRLRERFLHYSIWSYDQYFEKYVKYTRIGSQEMFERGKRTGFTSLAVRPLLRFLQLYILKLGFLDGLLGLQMCMLIAFFNTFVKQARLWELEHGVAEPDPEAERVGKAA